MSNETVMTLVPTPGDDVYLSLGRAIAGLCPSGFEQATLEAELGEGAATMKLACTPQDGSEAPVPIDPMSQGRIHELLELIREKGAEGDQRRWRKCEVTLRKGGRFQMDVHY